MPRQQFAAMPPNDSGNGSRSVLPRELEGFNWGALLFGPLWAIMHNVWVGLLAFIPGISIFMCIALGFKGNEWAWQHKRWASADEFRKKQESYIVPGIILCAVSVVLVIFYLAMMQYYVPTTPTPPPDY